MAITAVIPWGPGHVVPGVLVGQLLREPLVVQVVVVADGHSGEVPGVLNQSTGPTALGPAAARNRGAAVAVTPLVLFVDADVTLPEGWVAQAVALLEKFGQVSTGEHTGDTTDAFKAGFKEKMQHRSLSPLGRGWREGRVMGAGGLLGKRQHIDAAGRAQRHGSAGAKHEQKSRTKFGFLFLNKPLTPTLSLKGRGGRSHSICLGEKFLATGVSPVAGEGPGINNPPAKNVCAVMGLYAPGAGQGRLGQYKNQWLRFSYARSSLTRGGLLSSALLIHKADFDAVGGFDETFTRPSVEDTDLGRRLLARGGVAAVLVTPGLGHDKSLSLSGMLRLTYQRAFALAQLRGGRTQSSLPGFLYAVMFFALVFWPGVALGLAGFVPGWGLAAGGVLGLFWAAKDFFVSLSHDLGPAALVWAVPLMMLEMPVAFLGGVCGVMWPRRPAQERGAPHA